MYKDFWGFKNYFEVGASKIRTRNDTSFLFWRLTNRMGLHIHCEKYLSFNNEFFKVMGNFLLFHGGNFFKKIKLSLVVRTYNAFLRGIIWMDQ